MAAPKGGPPDLRLKLPARGGPSWRNRSFLSAAAGEVARRKRMKRER